MQLRYTLNYLALYLVTEGFVNLQYLFRQFIKVFKQLTGLDELIKFIFLVFSLLSSYSCKHSLQM